MANVLVVDDEPAIRETFAVFLEMGGHKVALASDVASAVRLLAEESFDVALCDIVMPGANGMELLKELRLRVPTVKVIMITGLPTVDTATESWHVGAFDYLPKPVSKSGLLNAVARAVHVKDLEEEKVRLARENRRYQEDLENLVEQRTAVLWQQRSELQASHEKIKSFARRILRVREEEKKRLSQVLHHEAGSLAVGLHADLAGIGQDLKDGNRGAAEAGLAAARDRITAASKRLRAVAVELRPPDLDLLGIVDVLRDLFARVTRPGEFRLHFDVEGDFGEINESAAVALYRTAQEGLTNVVQHAHATTVQVVLKRNDQEISLSIHDDGVGFRPDLFSTDGDRGRLGVQMMQEMAEGEGGHLTLESESEAGTTLSLMLPPRPSNDRAMGDEA